MMNLSKSNTAEGDMPGRERVIFYTALIFSSLCLLIPAFYNHYPLVNPDTGVYLASGFTLETPSDRPIVYGLMAWLLSFGGWTLWTVVFAQGYCMSWLIFRVMRHVNNGGAYIMKSMVLVLLLSVGSSLSWLVSQVQPDLSTSIAYLCIVLILIGDNGRKTMILLYLLFLVSVAAHLSHPLLMVASLVALLLLRGVYATTNRGRYAKKISVLIVLSLASILVMGPALSKSKHIFFMASLQQKGVLQQYLADKCGSNNYALCAYKDKLNTDPNDFLWSPNSPIYLMGGWKAVKPEFSAIIHDITTTPKYLGLFAIASVKQAGEQAKTFTIGDGNQPFGPKIPVYQAIQHFFPTELEQFKASWQNSADILTELQGVNRALAWIIMVSMAGILYILIKWKRLSVHMKILLVVCMTGVVLNCIDCAAFGIVNGRYGCKMIWLLPFCVLAFALSNKQAQRNAAELNN